jgi:hypothetical protein
LTAVITADAVRAPKLRRRDDAIAIVKSAEVMIARTPMHKRRATERQRCPPSITVGSAGG